MCRLRANMSDFTPAFLAFLSSVLRIPGALFCDDDAAFVARVS